MNLPSISFPDTCPTPIRPIEAPICQKPVQMPYDPEGAHTAFLQPGESARLFGWLVVTNNTPYNMQIDMEFHLHDGGLFIKIDGQTPDGQAIHIEQYVHMNAHYSLEMSGDTPILAQQDLEEAIDQSGAEKKTPSLKRKFAQFSQKN